MSEIEEVVEVTHFSATVENGELKYQATIRTIYGGVTLNG
ncbi:phage protein [Proteus mirabilis]|nr:phage protein [Proteus mirabilis]